MIEKKILDFGDRFRDRLDLVYLDGALDYVNYNECVLAFEEVCSQLCENNVPISLDEFNEAVNIATIMQLSLDTYPFKHLSSLVLKK